MPHMLHDGERKSILDREIESNISKKNIYSISREDLREQGNPNERAVWNLLASKGCCFGILI